MIKKYLDNLVMRCAQVKKIDERYEWKFKVFIKFKPYFLFCVANELFSELSEGCV